MKQLRLINLFTILLISCSALAILLASVMIFINPQPVIKVLGLKISVVEQSGILSVLFGFVGFVVAVTLIYLFIKDRIKGLTVLTSAFGLYALYRLMTILFHGSLSDFGRWLFVDSILFLISVILLLVQPRRQSEAGSKSFVRSSISKASFHDLTFSDKRFQNTEAA